MCRKKVISTAFFPDHFDPEFQGPALEFLDGNFPGIIKIGAFVEIVAQFIVGVDRLFFLLAGDSQDCQEEENR